MIYYIISAALGIILGSLITFVICKNKFQKETENFNTAKAELLALQTQLKTQEDFRNLIKEDFSKLAAQTINNQQEDLRKQNREILDDKIKPLNEKLQEFQKQVSEFHKSGEVNKTEIIKEIENLRNNNI